MTSTRVLALALLALAACQAPAGGAVATVSTLAGNGTKGYVDGSGGPTGTAELWSPTGVAVDSAGNIYVADRRNYRVRMVGLGGAVTTLAGNGQDAGMDGTGGPNGTAAFAALFGIAVGPTGTIYVTDSESVREIGDGGFVSTLAGNGLAGDVDGTGGATGTAELNGPNAVAVDAIGDVYVADTGNNQIREIDALGNVSTVAGNGTPGFADGTVGSTGTTELNGPAGLALDALGNIYVADTGNNRIRKIDTNGTVSTFAGTGARGYADGPGTTAELDAPQGLAADALGNLYVADSAGARIRQIDVNGNVSTLAGNGTPGDVDGTGGPTGAAEFSAPSGVAVGASGTVYVADTGNQRIRAIRP